MGLGYGTLGGYGVGSGLAGYSGIGLLGHGGSVLGGLGVAPPPVPVAAPAPSPVLPPPQAYAPQHVIGTSVHTTITKQVSTAVTLGVGLAHCGRVTQICVFNTAKLGTSASSP